VKLQIAEIFNACIEDGTAHRIPDILENLPTKLHDIYRAALLRVHNGDSEQSTIARKVLQWVMYARRPMSLLELEDALSHSLNQKSWQGPSKNLRLSNLSRYCGNLLSYDESERVIYLSHHTVFRFLKSYSNIPSLGQFYFQPSEAHRYLGKLCVTYLIGDFEQAVTITKDTSELKYLNQPTRLASLALRNNDRGLLSPAVRLGKSFATGRKKPDGIEEFNSETRLRCMMSARNTQRDQHFHLLEYCIKNWHQHCSLFTSEDIESFTAFHTLVFRQNPPRPWKPWGDSDGTGTVPYWEMFDWAVRHVHRQILQIWRKNVSDLIAASSWKKLCLESGEQLLSAAFAAANFELISILIENCIEAAVVHQIKTPFGITALYHAAAFGYPDILDTILYSTTHFNKSHNNRSMKSIALQAAAGGGHEAIVERLIEENADVNADPSTLSGRTALQAAAGGGAI
jgi:hypothetical protein